MLFLLLDEPRAIDLCEGALMAFTDFPFRRLGLDPWGRMDDGGDDEPYNELNVDEDFVTGVPSE